MTRLLLALMRAAHYMPLGLLRACGRLLGAFLYRLAPQRRRVAQANIDACLPELTATQRRALVRQTFRLFGQGFLDRAILWHASAARIRALVHVDGGSHLTALAGPCARNNSETKSLN